MAKELRMNKLSMAVLSALGVMVLIFIISRATRGSGGGLPEGIKLSELISASIDLAERAGKKVVQVRNMDDAEIGKLSKGNTKEGKKEYVTIGDKESHQIIVSGLMSLWPNLQLQSEESDMPLIGGEAVSRKNSAVMSVAKRDETVAIGDLTVWVDPLDATQEYTEGQEDKTMLKYVTVMVCIAVNGYPVAGIIHEPFTRVTNWAWVDHGLSKSLHQQRPKRNPEKDLYVIYSRSHPGLVSEVAVKAFMGLYTLHEEAAGGAGYKVLEVVKGNADLYLHTTRIKKWDTCAGNAVLNAVGGKMTTIKGEELDYSFSGGPQNEDGLVAAMPETMQQKYLTFLQTVP